MKEYILDANILFSGLLSKKDFYRKIFQENKFYLPDFALIEIAKYKQTILNRNQKIFKDLQEFVLFIFSKLIVVPDFYISDSSLNQAIELCSDIDEKDSVYIALSIEMSLPLVTRDRTLTLKLKEKGFLNIILFDEFIKNL
jgi:predicted nucleic acid-binding protein